MGLNVSHYFGHFCSFSQTHIDTHKTLSPLSWNTYTKADRNNWKKHIYTKSNVVYISYVFGLITRKITWASQWIIWLNLNKGLINDWINSCVPAAIPSRHKQEQRYKTLLISSVTECSDPKQQRGEVKKRWLWTKLRLYW